MVVDGAPDPGGGGLRGVFVAAIAPTIAVIAGMAVEPHAGTIAILLVPLVVALLTWAVGSLAPPGTGGPRDPAL